MKTVAKGTLSVSITITFLKPVILTSPRDAL